ncbi:hypothetical protein PI125_g8806 [Phytophthora idaei]|nr:hypothetical protein PI125_g8806 [Phytophthora idaei]KAG3157450.1 hypothetical protein PI126_g8315 [Phytophthora idaei]
MQRNLEQSLYHSSIPRLHLKTNSAMYSADYKWRAVTLHYAYAVPCEVVGRVLGVSGRAVRRWYAQFKLTGHVPEEERESRPVYPPEVASYVSAYVKDHPCFYAEELLAEVKTRFPGQRRGLSATCLLRLLRFDLNLLSKVLERRAREALPFEVDTYLTKLRSF